MDIFTEYATDHSKEEAGVWQQLGNGELLIARAGNRKYSRRLSALVEKNQRTLDLKNDASDDLSDEIMASVMAETILLGWRGSLKFKGADLGPYTKARAREILAVKDFRAVVNRFANEFEAYKLAQDEVAEANL
jgi:hypothetical protein